MAPTSRQHDCEREPVTLVDGSIYELYRPNEGPAQVEILFFHGSQLGDTSKAYLSTWTNENNELWPATWLPQMFPQARILSVSYDASMLKTSKLGWLDLYRVVENLIYDIGVAGIGQTSGCPVILVGHCFGGLVIKQLCVTVHKVDSNKHHDEIQKMIDFLKNLRGIFFYDTRHCREHFMDDVFKDGPLLEYFVESSSNDFISKYFVESSSKDFIESSSKDFIESSSKDFVESSSKDFIESSSKDFVESSSKDFVESSSKDFVESSSEDFVESYSKDAAMLDDEFRFVCQKLLLGKNIASVEESNTKKIWRVLDTVMDSGGSARYGEYLYTVDADHFTICKPESKNSLGFKSIIQFIGRIKSEVYVSVNSNKKHLLDKRKEDEDDFLNGFFDYQAAREASVWNKEVNKLSSSTSTIKHANSPIKQERKAKEVIPMEGYLLHEADHLRRDVKRKRKRKTEKKLRRDVQDLGWRSFKEKFDPEKILCLYKASEFLDELELLFFHIEGMATLVGVGVPFATVLTNPKVKNHFTVKEGPEVAWRELWVSSNRESFCPIVFKRQKTTTQTTPSSLSYSSAEDAASKFGVGMIGSNHFSRQTFKDEEKSSKRGVEVDWLNQLYRLIRDQRQSWQSVVCAFHQEGAGDGVCANETGQSKSGSGSGMRSEGEGAVRVETGSKVSKRKAHVLDTSPRPEIGDQEKKSKSKGGPDKFLTVVVLISVNRCKFGSPINDIDTPTDDRHPLSTTPIVHPPAHLPADRHRLTTMPIVDPLADLHDKCFIKPIMTVDFFSDGESSDPEVHVKFDVQYQLQGSIDNPLEFGWYHDKLSLSFGCVDKKGTELLHNEVLGQKSIDIEEVNIEQKSLAVSKGTSAAGAILGGAEAIFLRGGVTGSHTWGTTDGSSRSEQISKKYSVNGLTADSQFTITDTTLRSKIHYEAALRSEFNPTRLATRHPEKMWDADFRSEKKSTGMFSTVSINVLADWILKSTSHTTQAPESHSSRGDHQFKRHEFVAEETLLKHERQNSESKFVSKTLTLNHKNNTTFVFNHRFRSKDLEATKQASLYRWFLTDGTERPERPVRKFLDLPPLEQTSQLPATPRSEIPDHQSPATPRAKIADHISISIRSPVRSPEE